MKDIGAHVRYTVLWAGARRWCGPGANVLLSGGTVISCNDGALRDSRSADLMCVGGHPLLCGGVCVRRGCGRVCSVASYGPW
jgi:hypothetical protein